MTLYFQVFNINAGFPSLLKNLKDDFKVACTLEDDSGIQSLRKKC